MGKREEQKQNRRQQILLTALHLFVTKGYAATKISDIAEAVPMSVGLMFHYFKSKELLYQELVETGLNQTRQPALIKCDSAIAHFEIFTTALFDAMHKQPYVAQMFVLMAQTQRSMDAPEHIRQLALCVDTITEFIPLIRKGQQEGSIRKGDPLALSNCYWCSIQGIAEQYAAHPDMPLPDPDWVIDIIRRKDK